MYCCGLLTVSDSCYYDKSKDVSGKVLNNEIGSLNNFKIFINDIVPDEIDKIAETLIQWTDIHKLNFIITTGGTGFTPRDVTPEATLKVINKNAQSISQTLLMESLKITPLAILSRGISGIRGSTLIINLPGSPKAVKECVNLLTPILPHALDQLTGKLDKVKDLHRKLENKKSVVVVTAGHVADRSRSSQFPLLTVGDAQQLVFTKIEILSSVVVDITDSLDMVTSDVARSRVNVPPFNASIKDGYAVRFADGAGTRHVLSVSNAGDGNDLQVDISQHTCVRISTGAKVPPGADAVVQVEDTELILRDDDTGAEKTVDIKIAPTQIGQDIRPIGNDLKIGDVMVDKGVVIGPSEIGLMAMGGVSKVPVVRQPVVGILSTGNELVGHTEGDVQDRIIDCNRPLLISLYKSHNFKVKDLGIVKDEPQVLLNTFLMAFESCDVIVTTGGVSMGEKDYVQSVLRQDLNAEIHFGRIFMKPGKPMTFSTVCNEHSNNRLKLIFSLPGNPVSAFVTSYLFVISAVKRMAGYPNYHSNLLHAKLQHDVKLDPRPEYRRCKIISKDMSDGTVCFEVSSKEFGNQMSSRLASCVAADGLICLPPSSGTCKNIEMGTLVPVLKL